MNVAYVDTSCLVAIAFREPGAAKIIKRLETFDQLASSNLLEAELRAAFSREGVAYDDTIVDGLSWFLPDEPLSEQMHQVLAAGYVRGADLWHLACALALLDDPGDLTFLSLDDRQTKLAKALRFKT